MSPSSFPSVLIGNFRWIMLCRALASPLVVYRPMLFPMQVAMSLNSMFAVPLQNSSFGLASRYFDRVSSSISHHTWAMPACSAICSRSGCRYGLM